jgi:hypothetical protein
MEAKLVWSGEINSIVLCPYCNQPEMTNNTVSNPVTALCNQGEYTIKGRFSFEIAILAMKRREKDLQRKLACFQKKMVR